MSKYIGVTHLDFTAAQVLMQPETTTLVQLQPQISLGGAVIKTKEADNLRRSDNLLIDFNCCDV